MRFHTITRRPSRSCNLSAGKSRLTTQVEILERRLVLSSMISISDSSVALAKSGNAVMNFTVTRSGDLGPAITLAYTTSDGTATSGTDYTTTDGSTVIPAGATNAIISVPVTGSLLAQGNRTFSVTLTSATAGNTPVSFSNATTFQADGRFKSAKNVTTGDINGDGKPDLVITNWYSDSVSVLLNTTQPGASTPTFAHKVDFSTGKYPAQAAIGDLNGDGRPDIAVTSTDSNQVTLLLNATAPGATLPSFSTGPRLDTGITPTSLTLADLNLDGLMDLIVINQGSANLSVLLNTTAPGGSSLSFSNNTQFAVGNTPISVAVGDLNGDGKPDLVVANKYSNTVSILLNTMAPGASTSAFATKTDLTTQTNPVAVAIGDLNGDGRPDIGVVNAGFNDVSVFVNTTPTGANSASFTIKSDFVTGSNPSDIAILDINGDGAPDLAVSNYNDSTVSVLLNNSTAGATTPAFAAASNFSSGVALEPSSLVVADFNGDGKPDFSVSNAQNGSVSVLLNITSTGVSNPTLSTSSDFSVATGNKPKSIAIGDINGDGKPDMVVANYGTNTVSVLLNTTSPGASTPTFAPKNDFETGTSPISVVIADINHDGRPDLAVANNGSNSISVLLNTTLPGAALPRFTTKIDFQTGAKPTHISAGDLNNDGKIDLAVTNENAGTVSLFLNTAASGTTTPTFAPKTDLVVGSNPIAVAIGDLNGDGRPDIAVANSGSNSVSVVLNKTKAGSFSTTFAGKTDFPAGPTPEGVVIADLNGDGMPDLALASTNQAGYTVSVLLNVMTLNTFTAEFSPKSSFNTATRPYSLAAVDLNGDGKPDLVVGNFGSNCVSILVNTTPTGAATPNFAPKSDFSITTPYSVAVADLNGDGKPDIAAATFNGNTASVLLNTTVPTVTLPTGPATGTIIEPSSPATIAINGGNNQSVNVAVPFTTPLSVLVTNTSGGPVQGVTVTFTAPLAGAGAFFQGNATTASAITNSQGIAAAPVLTAGLISGPYTVTAQVANIATNITYNLTNLTAATTVNLVSSNIKAALGDAVTFTASMAVGAGTPDGAITFFDGANQLAVEKISAGVATYSTASLKIGTHLISASYSGSAGYLASTSNAVNQVIALASSVSVSVNPDPSLDGDSVTLTSTITARSTQLSPSGTVSFYDGTTLLGTGNLSGMIATLDAPLKGVGVHSIMAKYFGDSNFASGISTPVNQQVKSPNKALATSIAISSSTASSEFGDPIVFKAMVSSSSGTPDGAVTLFDNGNLLGVSLLNRGVAYFQADSLTAGNHHVTVSYSGTMAYLPSTSTSITENIIQTGSRLTLVQSSTISPHGKAVNLRAIITTSTQSPATGFVSFYDGSNLLSTVAVANMEASLPAPLYGSGFVHKLKAVYSGDAQVSASQSSIVAHSLTRDGSIASVLLRPGVSPKLTNAIIHITGVDGGVPSGMVVFSVKGRPMRKIALLNGEATVALPKSNRLRPFTLRYLGDSNFNSSSVKGGI